MSAGRRLVLLNPNTSVATTEMMTGIARRIAPAGTLVEGRAMRLGPPIVTDEAALAESARHIAAEGLAAAEGGADAILISGFGDPGLADLRRLVPIPVTGIAEAGMAAAAAGGRRFSIVTTTPDLHASITGMARDYGHRAGLASLRITPGQAEVVMADPTAMIRALVALALACRDEDGAEAILIGGGPLAAAAEAVAEATGLPVIEPVAAGVALALARMGLTQRV